MHEVPVTRTLKGIFHQIGKYRLGGHQIQHCIFLVMNDMFWPFWAKYPGSMSVPNQCLFSVVTKLLIKTLT